MKVDSRYLTMILTEIHDSVGVLKLNRGVTNAINLNLVSEITKNLQKMKKESDIRGLVLSTANEKFFAIGFDIPELFELERNDFKKYYQSFNQLCLELYTFPKPTIAALTGHAIAGGCIIALCCDYRYIAEGRKLMGLNEVKLGVPIPYPGDCILRQLIGDRNAMEMIYTGDFYPSEKLLEMGVVNKVLPLDQVLNESISKATSLGTLPQEAFRRIKRNRVELVETQIRENLAEKEQIFLEHWFSDTTRELLKVAMKKF
ncbi:MAG: enoyl-CoA hydratase/isomerase family protein [Candidatus Heimdallarchaeota archaeon]|nr:MAG: enoyl-CoA hydratase/isomerase family protein [Candidatus Heimdallarchaeota archaeon]